MISRPIAVPGLVCMAALGRALVGGSLTVGAAANRAVVLMAVLWLLDRVVRPLVAELLRPPQRRLADADRGGPGPARGSAGRGTPG